MNPFNDIETWQTLLCLSEGRQLNQIAHENEISLAALIRRIRTIENTWGVKLLSTNKPIRLTSAAVNFLPEIRTLCESHRKLQHRFETAKDITPASPARSVLQSLLVLSVARIPIAC